MLPYPSANRAVSGLTMQGQQPSRWFDPDLVGQMNDGFLRNPSRVLGETTGLAQAAQM